MSFGDGFHCMFRRTIKIQWTIWYYPVPSHTEYQNIEIKFRPDQNMSQFLDILHLLMWIIWPSSTPRSLIDCTAKFVQRHRATTLTFTVNLNLSAVVSANLFKWYAFSLIRKKYSFTWAKQIGFLRYTSVIDANIYSPYVTLDPFKHVHDFIFLGQIALYSMQYSFSRWFNKLPFNLFFVPKI